MLKSKPRPVNADTAHARRPKLGIRRASTNSERHADQRAHALTGRTPDRIQDSRAPSLEGTSVAGPVQALIELQRARGTDVRSVPGDLGADLGPGAARARLHVDEPADIAARAVGAQAFAVGDDVFFARGRYRPDTESGRALIAHELTHVLEHSSRDAIERTPGVAYSSEAKAAEAAFAYLLDAHEDALDMEWGGYIYRVSKGTSHAWYHSEPRTDNDPHSVNSTTERYAIAESEDARIAHARDPNSGVAPPEFQPTRGWIEPEDIEKRGGSLTATYHIHPSVQNKARGFSDEVNDESLGDPYAPKRTGDIPLALRKGLNSYMIDLDEVGYPLHEYRVADHQADKGGMDAVVGLPPSVSNSWKCQFGFKPDGTIDEDGKACKGVAPNEDARKHAEETVESRVFAAAVQMGDISKPECLRMLKAADMSDDVALCGIDPRTPEEKRRDELERMMQMMQRMQRGKMTAHDWL